MEEGWKALNMRVSEQFFELLENLSIQMGKKPKVQIVEEAVRVFAQSGRLSKPDSVDTLKSISSQNSAIQKDIDEVKTLCLQILKNQQTNS